MLNKNYDKIPLDVLRVYDLIFVNNDIGKINWEVKI
jgi:hypothetical protein